MIINEELFKLEDCVFCLKDKLLSSSTVKSYLNHERALREDLEVEALISQFQEAKSVFERIEPYGNYAPGFREARRKLRKEKRALDTNPTVLVYKQSETELQNVLDYLALDISKSISEKIKVDAGNPFFEFASRGCGGGCHGK
ncbi:hypothetical protein CBF37_02280 [Vagococcus vulneris]|uniref:Uncharacterized protein n=1 Tax=Vagococcus vulneris TaxID=1977869 RepID=A0A430A1M5_9ENTE|nr:hypothetical protein CBF37_02280 [Vagococcus vulneris]